ncbi:MAG: YncE family protein [Candidatus Electryonea clarkiae]|nr:YncE family protein [Candidatus Electryonea clarkiae]MDP8286078.1 YncE family protein [Candidatus Electryonea clarkiae]
MTLLEYKIKDHKRKSAILIFCTIFLMCGCEENFEGTVVNQGNLSNHYLVIAGANTLTFLDIETDEFLDQSLGPGNAPNWILPAGNKLFVVNSFSNDLSVFTAIGDEISFVRTVDLGLEYNRNPFCAVLTDEGRLLVTNLMENSVTVIDTSNFEIIEFWNTGISPEQIVVDKDFAYVICTGYDFNQYTFNNGVVMVHSLTDGNIIDSMIVGVNAQFAAFKENSDLHIVCTGDYSGISGNIQILGTNPLSAEFSFEFGSIFPGRIDHSNWGTSYIASGGWKNQGQVDGLLLSYKTVDDEFLWSRISVGLGAIDVAVDEENERVFVACFDNQSIDEIRGDSLFASYALDEPPQVLAIWEIP